MKLHLGIAGAAAAALIAGLLAGSATQAQAPKPAAVFTPDGKLEFPKDYRTWIFLSAGMDMTYGPNAPTGADHHMFDNVFVDRASYETFVRTGRWPEGSFFVLEIRGGQGEGSINKGGLFQTNRMAVEVHLKDKRYPSGWAFFGFNGEQPAQALPQTSACNQCHEKNAAVDTTFVQFYPTLLPVAKEKQTLSEAYLAAEK
ncbi:cytochrome P460 family protein [Phenylobacterium sp.]|uniref:cytochrome P460 family protein n=1 Tax=Phenylobacterium sp. TaxID=1871053 RepID=UPI002EDA28EF